MENPSDETQSVRDDSEDPRREDDDINAELRAIEQVHGEPSYPIKIHADVHSEVWYKSDIKLGLPKSYAYIQYISPLPSTSAKNAAMQELFAHILQKSLASKLKGATNTKGMNYKLHHHGSLTLEASGVNKKLLRLMEAITKCITQSANFVTEDLFRGSKEELLKFHCTWFLEPDSLSKILLYSIMTPICWSPIYCYSAISTVEFHEFQQYLNNFSQLVYIRSFVQGNLTESDTIQSVQKCVRILNNKGPKPNTVPLQLETVIPCGVRCCRVQSLDPHNRTSCTSNYYQFENPSLKLSLMIEVFGKTIISDIWKPDHPKTIAGVKHLDRSKIENLRCLPTGYVVTAKADDDDFNVALGDSWIEDFRKSLNAIFRDMTVDYLRSIKEFAIEELVKQLVVAGSKEQVCENWGEINAERYIFDRQSRELEILREMSLKEFREWMVNLSMDESDRRLRKLTSQVVGYDEVWNETPEWNRAQTRVKNDRSNIHTLTYSLKYLTHLSHEDRRKPSNYYIADIERYKLSLATFPDNRPTM